MILWKSQPEEPLGPEDPCSSRQWRLELSAFNPWCIFHFGLSRYVTFKESQTEKIVASYEVNLTKHFLWGPDHFWYDGPHCSWSLGWLHFHWNGWGGDCDKCYGEEVW